MLYSPAASASPHLAADQAPGQPIRGLANVSDGYMLVSTMDVAGGVGRPRPLLQPRAARADEVAAARVGTDDLVAWLTERRLAGRTLTELASAVGHSTHWVRWRLERTGCGHPRDTTGGSGGSTDPVLPGRSGRSCHRWATKGRGVVKLIRDGA